MARSSPSHFISKLGFCLGPGSSAPSDVRQLDVSGPCTHADGKSELACLLSRHRKLATEKRRALNYEKGRQHLAWTWPLIRMGLSPSAAGVGSAWGLRGLVQADCGSPARTRLQPHAGFRGGDRREPAAEKEGLGDEAGVTVGSGELGLGCICRSVGPAWGTTAAGHPRHWVPASSPLPSRPFFLALGASNRGQQWDHTSVPDRGWRCSLL